MVSFYLTFSKMSTLKVRFFSFLIYFSHQRCYSLLRK
nr:MAG TPA: hypothetical protein [Caudoviricetes sp.]